jgi:integrase
MNEVQPIKNKRDINRMKAALNGRDRLLFVFGINSGLRISDILKLRVSDVINADGKPKVSLSVKEKKTSKAKTFAFNKSILTELKAVAYDPTAYLFPSRKGGTPISRVQAYRILNAAAERAGISDKVGDIGTHSLRKTFGYHAYKSGVDISLLMRIFNHSSQAITLRYIGIQQEDINEVYTAINL